MEKVIVTIVGKDTVGIIAKVCLFFSENNINILNISQTTMQGYLNMMMITDVTKYKGSFSDLTTGLEAVEKETGCIIKAQREEIFDMMYKV